MTTNGVEPKVTTACLTHCEMEEYLAGINDTARCRQIEEHLAGCSHCAALHQELAEDREVVGWLHPPTALGDVSGYGKPGKETSPGEIDPDLIPNYRIERELGRGGMGIVYEAFHTRLHRRVALKVLPALVRMTHPQAVQRFEMEAVCAARLHHTNIVPIYECGEVNNVYYYTMELVEGFPVSQVIREAGSSVWAQSRLKGSSTVSGVGFPTDTDTADSARATVKPSSKFSVRSSRISSFFSTSDTYYRQVARWMAEVADALQYSHEQGVVHRDIKPSNLILCDDGRMMVTDFGLAKAADQDSITIMGTVVGTLRYMSPEQASPGTCEVDYRTDIYSLGATLYEMLVFQPVFLGRDEKTLLAQITRDEPRSLRRIDPHIPRDLEVVCLKSLEKDPARRYADAGELADDLRRYINELPIVARPPGLLVRAVKFTRRHKFFVVCATTVALLLVLVGGLYVKTTRQELQARQERIEYLADHIWSVFREAASSPASYELLASLDKTTLALIEIDPNSALAWNARSIVLEQQGKIEEAIESAKRSIELDRSYTKAWNNLARVYKNHGELGLAEQVCLEGLNAGEDYELWNTLGSVLMRMEKLEESAGAFTVSLELMPEFFPPWYNRGMTRAQQGRLAEAESDFRETIRLNSEIGEAYLNLAGLLAEQGRMGEAREVADKGWPMLRKTDTIASLIELARLYLKLGERDDQRRGLSWAEMAAKGAPENADALQVLLMAQLLHELYPQAVESGKELSKLHRKPSPTEYRCLKCLRCLDSLCLSVACARGGDLSEAYRHYEPALAWWPDEADARRITRREHIVLRFSDWDWLVRFRGEAERLLEMPASPP
ncbi:MAG: protein kinase [Phycisphaerae bacterium]|nr:protein kinase [Phycisphaerae bacterium]